MAPNEDLHGQVQQNSKRLDDYGATLHEHGDRLNSQGHDLRRLTFVVLGDNEGGVDGIVGGMKEMRHAVTSLVEWRHEWEITLRVVRVSVVVGLVLLGVIGAGVWWPQIEILLKAFGGLP